MQISYGWIIRWNSEASQNCKALKVTRDQAS